MSLVSREPVALAAGLMALVDAIFFTLGEFQIQVTMGQQAAIGTLLAAIVAVWARSRVSPVASPKDPPAAKPPSVPPLVATMVGLLLVGCAAQQEPAPCDVASYAAVAATCGDDVDICDAKISEHEAACADKIRGDQ